MKILLLTKKFKNSLNRHLHFDFLMKLKEFFEVIPIEIMNRGDGKPTTSASELYHAFHPDVMMIHFHGKHLVDYLKKVPIDCARVMIAVDSYKDHAKEFYRSNSFDLIIQRGVYDKDYYRDFSMVWLPFSADHKRFVPNSSMSRQSIGVRKKKVGFAGSWKSGIYTWRRRALQKLDEARLLLWREDPLEGEAYDEFLHTAVMGLTSTELKSPYAKVFEMMASGMVVLTPPFTGESQLFGSEECYVKYKTDCSDVVDEARLLLDDKARIAKITVNAHKIFLQRHTDSCRIHELHTHLKNVMEGNPVKQIWGL